MEMLLQAVAGAWGEVSGGPHQDTEGAERHSQITMFLIVRRGKSKLVKSWPHEPHGRLGRRAIHDSPICPRMNIDSVSTTSQHCQAWATVCFPFAVIRARGTKLVSVREV